MADGAVAAGGAEAVASDTEQKSGFVEFVQSRHGVLTILAGIAALVESSALVLNFSPLWGLNLVNQPFLTSVDTWLWWVTGTCLIWLPLVLLLLDPQDNMATGPSLALPLTTVGVLVLLAVGSAVTDAMRRGMLPEPVEGFASSPVLLVLMFALFGVCIVARIANASLFAWYQNKDRKQRISAQEDENQKSPNDTALRKAESDRYQREHGNAEALGAILATLVVGGIIFGAFLVGNLNDGSRLDRSVGVSITFAVIGIFAAIVFQDWLSDLRILRSAGQALNGWLRAFSFLAWFYNLIDLALVRIGAHVAGVSHLKWPTRYGVLSGTLLCLVAMAWFLPEPWGLVPSAVGFVLALSVSRLWSWVEDDRNIATITRFDPSAPIRVGFNEDYRDEALLGFIFVFLLIPIAMKQADIGLFSGQLYTADAGAVSKQDPLTWISFFGLELAKALPIVDWADIYVDRGLAGSLRAVTAEAKHFTFAARALVDLVLIAALIQAVSVSVRNRQQKTLYAAGKIRRLDEILEQKELKRAIRNGGIGGKHPVDFRQYDEHRLKELYSGTDDVAQKDFIKAIFTQSGRQVDPAIKVLEDLAKSQAPIDEMLLTLENVKREHSSFERKIDAFDFHGVLEALRAKDGIKEFKFQIIDFARKVGSPTSFAELAEQVIYDQRRDQMTYARLHMGRALAEVIPDLADPVHVGELLAKHVSARQEIFGDSRVGKKISGDLLKALTTRLQEIGPPSVKN